MAVTKLCLLVVILNTWAWFRPSDFCCEWNAVVTSLEESFTRGPVKLISDGKSGHSATGKFKKSKQEMHAICDNCNIKALSLISCYTVVPRDTKSHKIHWMQKKR